jgi:hypothetical protein
MNNDKDELFVLLENLQTLALDMLIKKFCVIIDDELFKSLSEDKIKKLRKLVEEIINAN